MLKTPFYLIDESKLVKNLEKIQYVREHCGARSLLALKCFSTWSVFPLMSQYMDGTTSSSLYEARLGFEKFGKEVHGYAVAYSEDELKEVASFADKIIFNSISQLTRFQKETESVQRGVRINPQVSYSHFDLADPARQYSRLGVLEQDLLEENLSLFNGVMFHYNCENDDFSNFSDLLDSISDTYEKILQSVQWVSLGGGIFFTKDDYPLDLFCQKLKAFRERFNVTVYLEPGEAAVHNCGELHVSILDIITNDKKVAIVDASTEGHMLDVLIYNDKPSIKEACGGDEEYVIAGRTCLAGDVFGHYQFPKKLAIGDHLTIKNAAGYTMVKKNWFNGISMPSIAVKRLDGSIEKITTFTYEDYVQSLS